MLKQLSVQDLALVTALEVSFDQGLTVITGESGAGKSILLAALGLVLGDRASSEWVRPGAKRAEVNAEFDLNLQAKSAALLADLGLDDADEPTLCLVRRTVNEDGRSRAFVNGTPVTLQVLRSLTEGLVDIHGQHDNLRLADRKVQLTLLDNFAGLGDAVAELSAAYNDWQQRRQALLELEKRQQLDQDRATLLQYQREELDSLAIKAGEFERLEGEFKRLSQVGDLQQQIAGAIDALEANTALSEVARVVDGIDDPHESLKNARSALLDALALAEDGQAELRRYADTLTFDPERLEQVDLRLTDAFDLARKHKVAAADLHARHAALSAELNEISADASAIETLGAECAKLEERYLKLARKISKKRLAAAPRFCKTVTSGMHKLSLKDASIECQFFAANGETGLEGIELWATTNPKYPAGPLSKIASGGELARISLAIQVVAAQTSRLPCLVLDEADVGVGGTTADVVGRMLRDLAAHAQVLCVTHAPQVAALGDVHLQVVKTSAQETQIGRLAPAERVDELARMLAGSDISRKTREYAQELLSEA